jgi:hypothetical protein
MTGGTRLSFLYDFLRAAIATWTAITFADAAFRQAKTK